MMQFYIDPGTGSFLVQAIVAGFLGIVFFFKTIKDFILSLLGIRSKNEDDLDEK